MLEIYFLNVGRGDSAVVKYTQEESGKSYFGVIDSNLIPGEAQPKALATLATLGATELSFIALTHPHLDHYLGMKQIIDKFPPKEFYSFPLDDKNKHIVKIAEKAHAATGSEDTEISNNALELIEIFSSINSLVKSKTTEWIPLQGAESRIRPFGFLNDIEISAILPMKREKGKFFEYLISPQGEKDSLMLSSDMPNSISLAFKVNFAGHVIVLGGDATQANWIAHQKELQKSETKSLDATIYKLPHHGSKADNQKEAVDYVFNDSNEEKFAIISAIGGSHHPHNETLNIIKDKKIQPYCTNLAKLCGARENVIHFRSHPDITKDLNSFISRHVTNSKPQVQPCQGDIHISISSCGVIEIKTELNRPCWLRNNSLGAYLSS